MCTELQSLDYDTVKIKWNSPDLESLHTLTKCSPALLRLDLNEAWSEDTTKKMLLHSMASRFELIEQPCSTQSTCDFRALENPHNVSIIADESFQTIEDINSCARQFHGINIKLPKCGGITPALDIIKAAKKQNLKILLGNMSEGQIGTAALIQVSSLADFLDLDGPLILDDTTATGIEYHDHVAQTSSGFGLGIEVKPF